MAPAMKEKHLREMRAHLKTELGGAMRECGYPENVGDYSADDELGEFVSEVKGIFSAGLQTEIGRVMDEEVGTGNGPRVGRRSPYLDLPVFQMLAVR